MADEVVPEKEKAELPCYRQLGYLKRPVAFRPCLPTGLAFSYMSVLIKNILYEGFIKMQDHSMVPWLTI